MSAFTVTMLQAITIGIGLVIGYFLNKANLKLWRIFIGFLVGFAISWLAGVIIWAFIFMSSNPYSAIVTGMARSVLFAMAGAGMGVYLGRRKAKFHEAKTTPKTAVNPASLKVSFQEANKGSGPPVSIPTPTGKSKSSQLKISTSAVTDGFDEDAAYSEVAHELETKTMDKGLWLKAMLHTGDGDERQQAMTHTRMRLNTLEAAFAATSTVSSAPAANPSLESTTDSQGAQPVPTTLNSDMESNRSPSTHAGDAWTYAAAAAVLFVFLYLMSNTTTPPVAEATTSTGATGEPLGIQREIAKYEAAPTQSTQSEQPASLAPAAAAAPSEAQALGTRSNFRDARDKFDKALAAAGVPPAATAKIPVPAPASAPATATASIFQDVLDNFDKALAAGGTPLANRSTFSQRPYDSRSGQIPLTEVVPAPPQTMRKLGSDVN